MLLGSLQLSDGTSAVGFACDAVAAAGGEDITAWGDWLADRSAQPRPRTVWQDLGEAALAGFSRGERG
jgi:allophanate hydrolase